MSKLDEKIDEKVDEILMTLFRSMKAVKWDDKWQVRMIGKDKRKAKQAIKDLYILKSDAVKAIPKMLTCEGCGHSDVGDHKRVGDSFVCPVSGEFTLETEDFSYNQAIKEIKKGLEKL